MDGSSGGRQGYLYIEPEAGKHTHTLVFLHGLGDSAQGMYGLFARGGPLSFPNLKVVLPTAPQRRMTCNGGAPMNSWFDIIQMLQGDDSSARDLIMNGKHQQLLETIYKNNSQSDIIESSDQQLLLAYEEMAHLGGDPSRVILGGFSQGCIVSLTSLLRFKGEKPLGGIIALSGVNMYDKSFEPYSEEDTKRIQETPLLMYLGAKDTFFQVPVAEATFRPLYKIYKEGTHPNFCFRIEQGLGHSLSNPEIQLISQWLQERFSGVQAIASPTGSPAGKPQEAEAQFRQCVICGVETKRCCTRCKKVYYCSVEHQRLHWKEHKPHCNKS